MAAGAAPENEKTNDQIPNSEVTEKPRRRRFTAAYKLKTLKQIEDCTAPGQVGALMRREGLYSSTITGWRRQRERGELDGLTPKKRGRKANPKDPKDRVISQLQRANKKLGQKLEQAKTVIEIQKKVSSLLGISLDSPENEEEK